MGSAVSLAVGLSMTGIVIALLPRDAARFAPERGPLLLAVAIFTLLSTATAASFYAELRSRSWRLAAHLATVGVLALTIGVYWPK
jgi:hypothetical protein